VMNDQLLQRLAAPGTRICHLVHVARNLHYGQYVGDLTLFALTFWGYNEHIR
jgi:hypothetical protein